MKSDYELLNSGRCRWCGHERRMGRAHPENCLSLDPFPPNHRHEIWPRVYVGVVEARTSTRFGAIVGILSEANARWIGGRVAMPACSYALIDHEDGQPGLVSKLDAGFKLIDEAYDDGEDVLFHCHQGASRSVCAAAAWQVRRGMPLDDALEAIFAKRPASEWFWAGWLPELRELERKVQGALDANLARHDQGHPHRQRR